MCRETSGWLKLSLIFMNNPLRIEYSETLAYLLLVLATLFWAGNFVVGRAVHTAIPPVTLAWWRWLLALLIMLPFVARPLWQARSLLRQHWLSLSLMSLLGVTAFNTLVYVGLQTLPASNGLLLLSTGPVFILALSWWWHGERLRPLQLLGMLISLSGIWVLVSHGKLLAVFSYLQGGSGNLWVLAAVISWSLYSVMLKKRPAALSGTVFFGLTVLLGWLFLTPFFLYELLVLEVSLPMNGNSLATLVYLAVFASIAAFIFWNRGVAQLGANRAGYFIHLIPVGGILLASIFLGERLEGFHWLGMLLIFAGIGLTTLKR